MVKRKLICLFLVILSLFVVLGCTDTRIKDNSTLDETVNKIDGEVSKVNVIINEKEYILNLEQNETTKALINLFPKEFTMSELNGNEKYVYLNEALPTASYNPKRINAGDVMLYGDNCLVVFYKSFNTSYSYTKIGHIDNMPDLGKDDVVMRFTK